ncbi:hypothetical protein [Nocardia cyriacigeorgica]|uniref:hypothetical protein n=1 Tax=Nocardia cyriacigeorgica TaxID=135487 RepID=UPI0024570B57|nr:hypothetical protein [Nocardia cyriacigeorgica]
MTLPGPGTRPFQLEAQAVAGLDLGARPCRVEKHHGFSDVPAEIFVWVGAVGGICWMMDR